MTTIDHKTLESLEFPEVLNEIASFSITELGKESVLSILPFKKLVAIQPELERIKEFSASLNGENTIPNHGFEAIERELFLAYSRITCIVFSPSPLGGLLTVLSKAESSDVFTAILR